MGETRMIDAVGEAKLRRPDEDSASEEEQASTPSTAAGSDASSPSTPEPTPKPQMPETPNGSNFRAKFLQKLASNKVLVAPERRAPQHQTLILFDWDDTLLCTTWLDHYAVRSEASRACLLRIAEAASRLLEMALKIGHTFIITNAQTGWVEHSAAKWAPEMLPTLQRVQVISARDGHCEEFPDDVDMWKLRTFLELRKCFDSETVTNLIAVGDSHYEMNAAFAMAKEFEYKLVKTIRFQQRPTPAELLRQLELVGAKFEKIAEATRNMSIALERKSSS